MQDIKMKQDASGIFDIEIKNGDIDHINSLDSAIEISLLCDARAPEVFPVPELRNGWLGNTASDIRDRQLGSLLWLLSQKRLTQTTLNETVDYTNKALAWIVEDKLAKNIDVFGEIVPKYGILLTIDITALNGIVETKYFKLWELTGDGK
jgi:phage gp46-like protein